MPIKKSKSVRKTSRAPVKKATTRKSVRVIKAQGKIKVKKADPEALIRKKPQLKPQDLGRVSHYFSNIGVAVIDLKRPIQHGDKLAISGGSKSFAQVVKSIQVDNQSVHLAKKGASIGLKVEQPVRVGYRVLKLK